MVPTRLAGPNDSLNLLNGIDIYDLVVIASSASSGDIASSGVPGTSYRVPGTSYRITGSELSVVPSSGDIVPNYWVGVECGVPGTFVPGTLVSPEPPVRNLLSGTSVSPEPPVS